MSTNGDLVNAPLIDTDLPTSNGFIDQAAQAISYQPYSGDLSRRYYMNTAQTALISMDNVPNSFGIDANQKGIIGAFATYGYDGTAMMRIAMHKPTSNVRSFIKDWDIIAGAEVVIPPGGANVSFGGAAAVCSQRQGEYCYAFMYAVRLGLFTDTLITTVYKITRDEYVQVAATSGGDQVLDGWNTDATLPVIQVGNGGQFFVSDEEEPFIWNVSGSVSNGGTAIMTGFRDDGSQNVGSYFTTYNQSQARTEYHYFGQSSAYLQRMTLPKGVYGFGPYIVHPWSSGNYAPPELWYFTHEFDATGFRNTGRFLIYRSRWKKGLYKKPSTVSLDDDPDFTEGRRPFPTRNPFGYAWETDVFNDAHYVGVVGPFSGISTFNPKDNILAKIENADNSIHGTPLAAPSNYYNPHTGISASPFGFTVVRDKKRFGTLHIVALDGSTYPDNGTFLNRVWFANSSDDGKTWSNMSQINPAIQPAIQGTGAVFHNYGAITTVNRTGQPTDSGLQRADSVTYSQWNNSTIGAPVVARTHDDVLLMGNLTRYTQYSFADGKTPPPYAMPADSGAKVALAVIDYTGRGAGFYSPSGAIFVQRANQGQIAWR